MTTPTLRDAAMAAWRRFKTAAIRWWHESDEDLLG